MNRSTNDNAMYKSMIKGMAATCKVARSNTERIKKVNRNLLSAQEKFLNLRANISIGDTNRSENTMVIEIRTQSWYSHSPTDGGSSGRAVMNSVFAGVFSPMKES